MQGHGPSGQVIRGGHEGEELYGRFFQREAELKIFKYASISEML